jgi:RNA polymerase sigma-70 factor, ECF subfamily
MMIKRNQRREFEKQALRHLDALYFTALRFAHNKRDADDLVQETLLSALSKWEQFRKGTNCRAWLVRILINNSINEYRKVNREREWIDRDAGVFGPAQSRLEEDPEGAILERLIGDEVARAVSGLPDEFREVVILADLQGYHYREIAEQLSCPLGTVMSRLHRARRLLERSLRGYARERGILRRQAVLAS